MTIISKNKTGNSHKVAALIWIIAATSVAHAQTAGTTAATQTGHPEDQLAEVIVTAERRAENVEKTAISIATISGDALVREKIGRAHV